MIATRKQPIRLIFIFSDYHKIFVAGWTYQAEIIDLSDPDGKCPKLPNLRVESPVGGLDENGSPWICGADDFWLQPRKTFCATYNNGTWQTSKSFGQDRTSAGLSLVSSNRYLITGGKERDGTPLANMELMRGNKLDSNLTKLPEALFRHCQVTAVLILILGHLNLMSQCLTVVIRSLYLRD